MSELPKGWVEIALEEIIAFVIDNRGRNPKSYVNSGIPVIDNYLIVNEKQVDLKRVKRFIDEETYSSFIRKYLKDGDVIVTLVGNGYGNVALSPKEKSVIIQNTIGLRCNQLSDNDFLYYNLVFQQRALKKLDIGAAQPSIKVGNLLGVNIILPPLFEQKAIAKILSSFDEKIELLRAQNETLETLAQTIFKEWFCVFNYPDATGEMVDSELGEIPKGWRAGNLLEIFELTGGGTPKTSIKEYWGGGLPWYSVVDAPNGSNCFVINTEKNISVIGLENSSTKLLRKGSTIVSARGTVGKLALVGQEMAMNQSCYGINGKKGFGDYYIFFQMKEMIMHIKKNVHGAVFDTITKATFEHINILIPSRTQLKQFENIAIPLMDKILNNVYQIQTLAKTRDTLLPKLMSGEIRVKGFEQ